MKRKPSKSSLSLAKKLLDSDLFRRYQHMHPLHPERPSVIESVARIIRKAKESP